LASKSSNKQKEEKYTSILQEVEPLLMDRLRKEKTKLEAKLDKVKNMAATKIQKRMRGVMTRKRIGDTISNLEDQLSGVENMLASTRSNLNEQRPKGLRKAIKKLQDRKSELNTEGRVNMPRDQKKEATKDLNKQIEHYESVIIKRKPGPKVKDKIDLYEGAAKK